MERYIPIELCPRCSNVSIFLSISFSKIEASENYNSNDFDTLNHSLVLSAFQRVNDVDLDNRSNVLAGIIQTNGIDLNTAKMVAVASGTKNIDAESLSPDALCDTHAEIVARRALVYYFYQQLEVYLNSGMCSFCLHLYNKNRKVF